MVTNADLATTIVPEFATVPAAWEIVMPPVIKPLFTTAPPAERMTPPP